MKPALVSHYLTRHGGLIQLIQEENGDYNAYLIDSSFLMSMMLGEGSARSSSQDTTYRYITERFDPDIVELDDLGDYPLHMWPGRADEGPVVSVEQRGDYRMRVLARDVPPGTHLDTQGVGFFQFWYGRAAVDTDNRVFLGAPDNVTK